MKHEEYSEALSLDALGALDGEEQQALDAHLAACEDDCRESAELRDVAAALAYTIAPIAPPGELRARILERITTLPQEKRRPESKRSGGGRSGGGVASQESDTNRDSKVLPLISPGRRDKSFLTGGRGALWAGALAASVVIGALVLTLAGLWSQNRGLRAEIERLTTQLNETRGELDRGRMELARARVAEEILTGPEAQITVLKGTEAAPQAQARLAFDQRTGRALFLASGLPPAPAGKAYQLWFIAGGTPLPGSVFKTDARGSVTLNEVIPAAGRGAAVFAVTLEPEEGMTEPTGDKYLLGSV